MKVLIIDNGSKHVDEIVSAFEPEHQTNVYVFQPEKDIDDTGFDIVVLSGGMAKEVYDHNNAPNPWFAKEFEYIRTTKKPIIAICLGMQMCVVALGGTLKELPEFINEPEKIVLNDEGTKLIDDSEFAAYEAHKWAVNDISETGFSVLSESSVCIELMYHDKKKIIATQFHPEVKVDGQDPKKLMSKLSTLLQ